MSITIPKTLGIEARTDALELHEKTLAYRKGEMPEEKYKHFRLTRGFYGQRQQVETPERGIQMLRIKAPFGRISSGQLVLVANVSERFTNGNLHLTTRQSIQLHHVKLNDAAQIYSLLEAGGLTSREACGNTVRNITGAAKAGIDPEEPFDISPYAHAMFRYFLRNPICQAMGRKFKVAFSSNERDAAFAFIHDIGVVPRIRTNKNGQTERGFKLMLGGGLGAQARMAHEAEQFLPADQLIPYMEAALRVFDRYGERNKRHKARLKFLIADIGPEAFGELMQAERKALKNQTYKVNPSGFPAAEPPAPKQNANQKPVDQKAYEEWLETNVFEQKQKGFHAVQIKLWLGDLSAAKARHLARLAEEGWIADEFRLAINQGLLLKFARKENLPHIFNHLHQVGLADAGYGSIADITACPGTDTCNLAVTNSTLLADALHQVVQNDFRHLIFDNKLHIKISGCMNSCGQHMVADIGFHGSSLRNAKLKRIAPAAQIVLGGGVDQNGNGLIAEKVIKVPTKKAPEALAAILHDYENNAGEGEYFIDYYRRVDGKNHFYQLLKPLAELDGLGDEDYADWGQQEPFKPEVGVGECAGVSYDVVGGLINDAAESLANGKADIARNAYAEAIYHAYNAFIIGAKALLLAEDVSCNTQIGIIKDFETHFVSPNKIALQWSFADMVLKINKNQPDEYFAYQYLAAANDFMERAKAYRNRESGGQPDDKQVVSEFYKA